MQYKERDIKLLFGKAGGQCSFKDCNAEIILDDKIVGQISHIVAKSSDGPRGDPLFPKEKLHNYENLILLCRHHHGIIDCLDSKYTVDGLKTMKASHEEKIRKKLSIGTPWECNLSQLYYVNIPRLSIAAAMNGFEISNPVPDNKMFHSLGPILPYLIKYESILYKLHLNARDLGEIVKFTELDIGSTISFNTKFRTKNVKGPYIYEQKGFAITGDISKDPHLYYKTKNYKLILCLDIKWMATSTSFCDFASGNVRVAGLCTIKNLDKNGAISATPLVIGTPKSQYDIFG